MIATSEASCTGYGGNAALTVCPARRSGTVSFSLTKRAALADSPHLSGDGASPCCAATGPSRFFRDIFATFEINDDRKISHCRRTRGVVSQLGTRVAKLVSTLLRYAQPVTEQKPNTPAGMTLGYARETPGTHPLAPQIDLLSDAGVDPARIYTDAADRSRVTDRRAGLSALLDYARAGDTTVVVGIDRLGRSVGEVMAIARELAVRRVGLRSLREGIDTDDPAGAMIVGLLASLAELDEKDPPPRQLRTGRTGPAVGRPRALDDEQVARAEQMRAAGESVPRIAQALGVSRATLYRSLAERRSLR